MSTETLRTTGWTAPKYLTAAEVAAILRCTPAHVRRLVARGELHAIYPGDMVRVAATELEVYLRRLEHEAERARREAVTA